MSTMHESDIEVRLRAALAARAELVRPEDVARVAPIPMRSRRQARWTMLAAAAAVLLVVAGTFWGLGSDRRSDQIAPRPDEQIELPPDVGRDWTPDALSSPARLDLDGDGAKERVEFLAEPTEQHDGRTRVQTTLSGTGEQAFGIVELGTTIGITALGPIDADSDGDQELVLYTTDADGGPGAPFEPVVLDLRDGFLLQVLPEDPELLASGDLVVPGSETEFYDRVHIQTFEVAGGRLTSTRSVNSFARASRAMILLRPETYLLDTYEWRLDEGGVLRPEPTGCLVQVAGTTRPCESDSADDVPDVTSESSDTIGLGEQSPLDDGSAGYSARVEDDGEGRGTLVIDGPGAAGIVYALTAPDPQVHTLSPSDLVGGDAASVVVTSSSDPAALEVVVATADQAGLIGLRAVGEIPLGTGTTGDSRAYRSWLTGAGAVVTAVESDGGESEGGAWEMWRWVRVSETEIAPLPWGSVCFDDVLDPTTGHRC